MRGNCGTCDHWILAPDAKADQGTCTRNPPFAFPVQTMHPILNQPMQGQLTINPVTKAGDVYGCWEKDTEL